MDLYNVDGYHIARLRRNHWTFNDQERFLFAASTKGLNIVDTKSKQVVLEARVVGGDSVVVTQGAFHNSNGHLIEIAMEDWPAIANFQASEASAAHTTSLPFARVEIAAIRKAMKSSQEDIECPRCGCPLTRQHVPNATQPDTHLVSCLVLFPDQSAAGKRYIVKVGRKIYPVQVNLMGIRLIIYHIARGVTTGLRIY